MSVFDSAETSICRGPECTLLINVKIPNPPPSQPIFAAEGCADLMAVKMREPWCLNPIQNPSLTGSDIRAERRGSFSSDHGQGADSMTLPSTT